MKTFISTMNPAAMMRHPWLLAALAAIAVLVACGGGAGSDTMAGSVGSGGTGAAVSGPINGFGSVIVNGIRFDDSSASITLDDDDKTARKDDDLRLGMMIEIEGDRNADGVTGKAASITSRSYVQGPISTIDSAGGRLTVLGVQVTVNPETVFDGAGVNSLNSLAVNDKVEIHGIADGAGLLKATRIERIADTEVRLTGAAHPITASAFTIGGITVHYQSATLPNLQGSVPDGALVRVKGRLSSPTEIDASEVRKITLSPAVVEGQTIELEGLITRFVSLADFDVNDLKVSAGSNIRVEGVPAVGARVEVEGVATKTQLIASKLEVKDDQEVEAENTELHGPIFGVNAATKTLTMRNGTVTVKWNASTNFNGLAETDLVQNLRVDVRGKIGGNALIATKIKRDN